MSSFPKAERHKHSQNQSKKWMSDLHQPSFEMHMATLYGMLSSKIVGEEDLKQRYKFAKSTIQNGVTMSPKQKEVMQSIVDDLVTQE